MEEEVTVDNITLDPIENTDVQSIMEVASVQEAVVEVAPVPESGAKPESVNECCFVESR